MNSRQFANVLVKVLGLTVFVMGIPGLVSTMVMQWLQMTLGGNAGMRQYSWYYAAAPITQLAVGMLLILLSRTITGILFRNDMG